MKRGDCGVGATFPGVRVERFVLVTVEAFDWNCPQHITARLTVAEFEKVVSLYARIAELDSQLNKLEPILGWPSARTGETPNVRQRFEAGGSSFPLAASVVAALRFAMAEPGAVTDAIALLLLGVATVAIAGLLVRTLLGVVRGELRTLSS